MSECIKCGAGLALEDRFCGECGIEIVPEFDQDVETIKPDVTEAVHQIRAKSRGKNTGYFLPILLGAGVLVALVGFYVMTSNQKGPSFTQARIVDPVPASNNDISTAKPLASSGAGTQSQTQSNNSKSTIAAFVKKTKDANKTMGISNVASHHIMVPSCAHCSPFLIYCVKPIQGAKGLSGRKTRASTLESRELIKRMGGNLQLLAFSEVRGALELGIIECSISGGGVPSK